jgi:AMP nucleosidase
VKTLTADEAIEELIRLHEQAVAEVRSALDRYVRTRTPPTAAERAAMCYPALRVTYSPSAPAQANPRAYAKFQTPGVYVTTVTQPRAFRAYLLEQLAPLVSEYAATISVVRSTQELPFPYVLEGADESALGDVAAAELAQYFPTPQLALVGDDIADSMWQHTPGAGRPLALFDAVRTDYSLRRLVHYTGTPWQSVQPWLLFTNYTRYVDVFVRWAIEQLRAGGRYTELVCAGGVTINASSADVGAAERVTGALWHRHQMPAYHLKARDGHGLTLVNIGVGPSNAKTITDHLAVLRPHCWLMIGHCGGLRHSQRVGDYVLAHGYLREDRILDSAVPPEVPIPALAEVQLALQAAAADVTGERGAELKARLRTGTVVTENDRNWELRWRPESRLINLSRAIAIDMESGTIAAQGYRFRVPYGTLLCVSDRPLHGEIKLPGSANAFYQRAVGQHLQIGVAALERLQRDMETLHSRKLRSFDEPPFR